MERLMKKVLVKVNLMLVATGLLVACSSSDEIPEGKMVINMLPETRSVELTAEQKAFVGNNNDFAFNFYRAIHEMPNGKGSNICSPMSLTYVLGMIGDGATGTTAEELTQVLGFGNGDKKAVNEYCQALIEQAPKADPSVMVQIANIVAADKSVTLTDLYAKDMRNYYKAEVASLDFSSTSAVDYLNKWCKKQTDGIIPHIIDNLDASTQLVLMNAIYFKATWTEKFDEKDTQEEGFTREDGTVVNVPMMHRNAFAVSAANETYRTLRLPFGSGDKWSMYILLPLEGKTTNDIIQSLDHESWTDNYYRNSEGYKMDIKIPRFTLESDLELNEAMRNLGCPSMFDKSEFSLISNNHHLSVSQIKQKAAIEVNEEGTKTTAVTVDRMDGAVLWDPSEFHADHPFVFLIQEEDTKSIFFIGSYMGE